MIQTAAILEGVSTLKDGSISVRFHTQELSPEQKVQFMEYLQKFGWMLFKEAETPFVEDEIPDYDPKQYDEIKSPSQRLKAVIFVKSQQDGVSKKDFNEFYQKEMARIIEGYKTKNLN